MRLKHYFTITKSGTMTFYSLGSGLKHPASGSATLSSTKKPGYAEQFEIFTLEFPVCRR
jgi:hypothetical protein